MEKNLGKGKNVGSERTLWPKKIWVSKYLGKNTWIKGGGQNFAVLFIDLHEDYIPNLGLLLCLEPFKKFVGVCCLLFVV